MKFVRFSNGKRCVILRLLKQNMIVIGKQHTWKPVKFRCGTATVRRSVCQSGNWATESDDLGRQADVLSPSQDTLAAFENGT